MDVLCRYKVLSHGGNGFALYLLDILAYEYIIMIEIVSKLHNLQRNFYIHIGLSLIVINKDTRVSCT